MDTNGSNGAGEQLPLIDFAHAEANRAEPQRLREVVRVLLRNGEVWALVAPHYRDEGTAGTLAADKAVAAYKVRQWDAKHGKLLEAFESLNETILANAVGRELRRVYELHGGRIVKALPAPEPAAPPA